MESSDHKLPNLGYDDTSYADKCVSHKKVYERV
jgi:hypothetical protein